ncbi:TIGR03557 family F420-dependent LLM class oxidoreductase [Kribbella sandramycini]|uniref:G6PDH family F420-dependent oxidoreductase n=1 Tax=Kribbella sandramycini TaxID=60450 RepID=A0A7Y4KYP2_9ACTN|nr:TIGR03557 family F420-dependent LLM class oxidoreductase [Kribbella sandramycini]MBB6569904.1 G6PDH family F420-dependent oxidoreductase [Kribbella sandramycini]NOL40271.1 TIGR03557 family F420-dependent LLM class oxidoreductase [Kribbella sandramycini]
MKLGFKLIAEAYGPLEIVDQAVRAEAAGFDFVEVSDHFHPWVGEHEHSGFAFSMLAAIAAKTSEIGLATGVTCPFIRYHPAVVAQAAATTAILSGGRFTLGLGSGERLNEHVVGAGWPAVTTRHEMLREAIEIIRLLWSGGYHSYDGKHLKLEDARMFDLPGVLPEIAVAAGGPAAARIAGELGDALFVTEPKDDLIAAYRESGGLGPAYAEVPLAWAPSEDEAAESARRLFRFGVTGWKVQAELPNPVNFDAATTLVTAGHMREQFGCGPDVARHVEVARQFTDAGYDRLALINAGPDMDGFFDFFAKELAPELRQAD